MSLFRRSKQREPEDNQPVETAAPEPAGDGPWDAADVPDLGARIDLGALRVPARDGMQLRLEVEKNTRQAVAVSLSKDASAVQLQAFAAPRSSGLWDEVRGEIAESIRKQGGTVDEAPGRFGTELVVRLPVKGPEGVTHRPARFLGVDGPRWFLRAVVTGRAAVEDEAAAPLEDLLADVVVVRGAEPHPPRDVLALRMPGRAEAPTAERAETADVLRRGPEITEVR